MGKEYKISCFIEPVKKIVSLFWAFSAKFEKGPSQNPLEHVWKMMKDKVGFKLPTVWDGRRLWLHQIRAIVKEMCDSVSIQVLTKIIESVHDK